jgi:carboxypeptidase family protein/TonB-dependent receptor-like protein
MRECSMATGGQWVARSGVAVCLLATHLAAQARTGAISGVVKDSAGVPIPDVEVTAIKFAKVVRTDTAGRFLIPALASGSLDFSFRRLAYSPLVLSVLIPADDTTDVEVRLGVTALQLTGVVVQEHAEQLRVLEAFEARRKQGLGHFVTRAEIERRHPLLLSDMMRVVPGAMILIGDNGRTALRFARVGRDNCPPQFFVDGLQVSGFSIDDMPPGDVEGVELYAGPAGLPPEFNRPRGTTVCGTVAIWTRIPGNDPAKP